MRLPEQQIKIELAGQFYDIELINFLDGLVTYYRGQTIEEIQIKKVLEWRIKK